MFEEAIQNFMVSDYIEAPLVRYEVKVPCNKREAVRLALEGLGCTIKDEVVLFQEVVDTNLGKKVSVNSPIIIASDVYIKTPLSHYVVKKVMLPAGLIGTITGIGDTFYDVSFNCDVKINPLDIIEGNINDIPSYPLDNYKLTPEQITIL